MDIQPHSNAWYDRLAQMQQGYYYPWRSHLPPFNGEDMYLELVQQHLTPETDVLDAACGHGEHALQMAKHCRSILAYDRVQSFIDLAQKTAREQSADNVTFLCHDSSYKEKYGGPRLPASDNSVDLIVSRRGPYHWIADAERVGRPGAVILMLTPEKLPPEPWNDLLPKPLRRPTAGSLSRYESILARLLDAGLEYDSWWQIEVPETFTAPEELYKYLAWGLPPEKAPSYGEVEHVLVRIFTEYGGRGGVPVRFGRLLWKAVLPG